MRCRTRACLVPFLFLPLLATTSRPAVSQTPTLGGVSDDCGGSYDLLVNEAEVYTAKVIDGIHDDWQLDVSAKGGPRIGLIVGDVGSDYYKTLGGNYREPESPWDTIFAFVTFAGGRLALNSGDLWLGFNFMGVTRVQQVGNSFPDLPGNGAVVLPGDRDSYLADLGSGPERFPRNVSGGIEIAFAPLVELNREPLPSTMGECFTAGIRPEPETDEGLVAGYAVYRLADTGGIPSPSEIGSLDNWVYFIPVRADVSVPDQLSTLHDPDGEPHSGDEAVTFRDVDSNPDGSPRAIGTPPEPGRTYWYAVQPAVKGHLDDWQDLYIQHWEDRRERDPHDWRVDTDGDGLFDAIELPRLDPPDEGIGPEFFSPQGELGLEGLGLTHGGLPVLSPLIHSTGSDALEDCGNGVDDDGDGFADCDDPDCDCALGNSVRVGRAGADELWISWETNGGAAEAGLYRGFLDSLWSEDRYDHEAVACGLLESEAWLSLPASDGYYLVVPRLPGAPSPPEGGFGSDSLGSERPTGEPSCP